MNQQRKYASSIKDMPLLFSDMRRTAILLCEGKTESEILELSLTNNIYQLKREHRRRALPLRMFRRLKSLSAELMCVLAYGDELDGKLIALLALLKTDDLFFAYMQEVYWDALYMGKDEILDQSFVYFIEQKAGESSAVAKWASATLVDVRNTYKNILCEVGIAKKKADGLFIQKPFWDMNIIDKLRDQDKPYGLAMGLEVLSR